MGYLSKDDIDIIYEVICSDLRVVNAALNSCWPSVGDGVLLGYHLAQQWLPLYRHSIEQEGES